MALMAMDHVRDFTLRPDYGSSFRISTATFAMFFNRWLTHLCAPVFCLLTGAGAALQLSRGASRAAVSRYLLVRGLLLLALEPTLISFGWFFNFSLPRFFQVIWALGFAMCVLAVFVRVNAAVSGAVGALIVALHNLLDSVAAPAGPLAHVVWTLLLSPDMLLHNGRPALLVVYPAIPWTGIVLLGFFFGSIFSRTAAPRRWIPLTGVALLALFCALRWHNLYGDPFPYTPAHTGLRSFMAFMDITKYPPSLQYFCATIGVAMLLLSLFERWQRPGFLRTMLLTFGRVPFFFYVLHIYLAHTIALALAMLQHADWRWWIRSLPAGSFLAGDPANYGVSMPHFYLIWIALLLALYPVCRWYARIRPQHKLLHYF